MATNKRWQNVSDFLTPILQSKCSWGTLTRELPTGQTWSRGPTRAQLEEGPACTDWPTGKPLTISWKEPQKGTFSGFRRQLDDYESLDLSPAERTQITNNLNKPDSTTCHGKYHWPNLGIIPDWNSLSETLSENDETREAYVKQEKSTETDLDVITATVSWQDVIIKPTTTNVMSSSWPPGHSQQHKVG